MPDLTPADSASKPQSTRWVVYFSVKFAFSQPLKTYSGGRAVLAGSHTRSAYSLQQPVVVISIPWKYGARCRYNWGLSVNGVNYTAKMVNLGHPTHDNRQVED